MTFMHTSPATSTKPAVDSVPTLGTYTAFVFRYRTLLILSVVAGLTCGLAVHFSSPERYTSTAHMVIVATTVGDADETQEDVSIDSALQLLRSDQVMGHVARQINYPGGAGSLSDDVATRPVINSRIVRLSVSALDPPTAQRAAAALTDRFFEVRSEALTAAALARIDSVDAELAVVETELAARYQLATEDDLLDLEEPVGEEVSDATGIRSLVTRRAQLHGERAFLEISAPNAGYLSRPATEPGGGSRTGLAITVSSVTTLILLAAIGLAALHQMRPAQPVRGQHRPPRLVRRTR